MATAGENFKAAMVQHQLEFGLQLSSDRLDALERYYLLLTKWNAQLHLVAPCSPEEFAVRHVLESLLLLKYLPEDSSVVDIGSGGGLPMIPCLLVRDDLRATLVESSRKKTVFLKEAVRLLNSPNRIEVVTARYEEMPAPPADFLTCRAIDRFIKLLPDLIRWASRTTTFLLYGGESLRKHLPNVLTSVTAELVPGSRQRFLFIGRHPI